ncbi:sensor histidine kinase [Terrisporobacter hibernicus]|uniref:histidine kinase n=1 Tax=Terrisporobacter hibernicus TaxID=2813371 RepID=A0AAX2ZD05_9FIRM|nr:sensor histidine kinase KdpD [Terrisporobacter hibernicus]UEL46600.1 sensor histidine kinase KdpD [Terrisporobacter hibernicus]
MIDRKINPDKILKKINYEERSKGRGHLKIFFGYAAGVGKTYAMLKAAHKAKDSGIDVVVGYIEPHARPETKELLKGLEVIPTLNIKHKSLNLNEFNIDLVIKRNPQVILVDELAHTNATGCRHLKRYQDINELLNLGFDVYTTVNVQHIESLNDIVSSITKITVRERIPDYVFDNADQVELVDIEPEELIERLNEGKIYAPIQARNALVNFFSIENLTALREIALRRSADRVNKISEKVKQNDAASYFTDEKILVCLSSSPTNSKIIRSAARMASAFRGEFIGLFVETSDFDNMKEEDKIRLRNNIHLAEQLGAKIETVTGDDIALQIAEFARLAGISKVILGRSNSRRKYFFGKSPLTERLTSYAPNLDIYIIPDSASFSYSSNAQINIKSTITLKDLFISLCVLILATIISFVFFSLGFSESNIITVYILGVLVTAILTENTLQSIISAFISVFVFNFFFTDPRFTFNSYDAGYPVTFVIMFISAFLTGSLASKIKRQANQSAYMAYRTKILLETNQLLQQESKKEGIIKVTAIQLAKLLNKNIIFYNSEDNQLLDPIIFSPAEYACDTSKFITSNEKAVAQWVFKNNKHAGATTNTLGNSKCLYLAIRVGKRVYGVVGIALENDSLDSFENNIMLSILGECAIALENNFISKQREEAATLAKNEQLRANLLRSISHDLRTPLTSIFGNSEMLLKDEKIISKEKRVQLYSDIHEDSLWLINLVENLLAATKIEDNTMILNMKPELMEEVINEALRHIKRKSINHFVEVTSSHDIIFAKMDAKLIIQVIINIVDNALKYTPENTHINIHTQKNEDMVLVEISDDGNGLSDKDKDKIFDMFYTVNNQIVDSKRSLGLGLALCKSIILAHGGEIDVKDNKPHGTIFSFTLPLEEVNLHE